MGFFDKIKAGRLFFGKKEPNIVVQFHFKGLKYVVEEFDLEFKQEEDRHGEPAGDVLGGIISFTISDMPDERLRWWIMDNFKKYDGEFRFFSNTKPYGESSLLNIQFKEASCVSSSQTGVPQGVGIHSRFVLSSRYLGIGKEEFEKK